MKSPPNENNSFFDFIERIKPIISGIIQNLTFITSTNSLSESNFKRAFFPEHKCSTNHTIDSISTVMAVLIYDYLCIGLKTLGTIELSNQRLPSNSISTIFDRITEKNLDIPLFHSLLLPLRSILELFVNNPDIADECLLFLRQNTSDSINYFQMKFPFYFDRGIDHNKKRVLGQVFTPISIVDFIFNEVVNSETEIIVDPAAGSGVFLLRALEKVINFDVTAVKKIIAIEKDPILSLICESAIKLFNKLNSPSIDCKVYNQDLFSSSAILQELQHEMNGSIAFLMNPPYTRQELIPSKEKKFIRNKVNSISIIKSLREKNSSFHISGQSSLYIYFILYISEFLNQKDRVGVIIPNSWMDVRYGSMLQFFLLNYYYIDLIISTRLEKLIPSADVNTAIMTLRKKNNTQLLETISSFHQVKFIRINSKGDLKHLTTFGVQKGLGMIDNSVLTLVNESRLLQEPKWGLFIKAPKYYLDLLENIGNEVNYLKDYASVRRGFTSGANEFFYIGKPGRTNRLFNSSIDTKKGSLILEPKNNKILVKFQEQGFLLDRNSFIIERDYWMHTAKNDQQIQKDPILYTSSTNELWIPNYLVKSPKELEGFEVSNEKLKYIVLIIPKVNYDELKPGLREYIKWGETWKPISGIPYSLRTTCVNRKYWYSLPADYYQFCPILCIMTINDRFPFFYNPQNYYFDARFYGITPRNELTNDIKTLITFLFLYLNSVFTSIQIELSGRKNLGEGGLDVKVYEYQDIKIPSFHIQEKKALIISLFQKVIESKPSSYIKNESSLSKYELDLFLKEICSFSSDTIEKMHNSLQEIVQARIDKAKTNFSYLA